MSNENQEVTISEPVGFLQKLGGSIKGIGFGLALIVAATTLLYWNEGRAVKAMGAIGEAELATVDLPNIDSIDSSFNGKLVYATGQAQTNDVLSDQLFGISTTGIRLERALEYFQWVESSETKTTKTADGKEQKTTTYSYTQEWVDAPINSSSFYNQTNHENSVILQSMAEDEKWQATNVAFGAYSLPKIMIDSIRKTENMPLELGADQIAKIDALLVKVAPIIQNNVTNQNYNYNQNNNVNQNYNFNQNQGYQSQNMTNQVSPAVSIEPEKRVHVRDHVIYLGKSEANPVIGDVRISYFKTPNTNISFVAKIHGNTFEQFIASNGNRFISVKSDQVSKEMIFQSAKDSASMTTWIFRVVGIILAFVGVKLIFGPIALIANYVPVLGSIVDLGVGLISSMLGFAWSFTVIALAWIRFRPILAIALLVIAAAFVAFLIWKGHQKKGSTDAEPTPAPAE